MSKTYSWAERNRYGGNISRLSVMPRARKSARPTPSITTYCAGCDEFKRCTQRNKAYLCAECVKELEADKPLTK